MGINPEMELQSLAEFRERVQDLNQNDATLIRYLRARNHNLSAAEAMIRHSINWRIQNDVDNWDKWVMDPYISKLLYINFSGLDYGRHPVVYMPMGAWPVRNLFEEGRKLEEGIRQIIWSMEKIMVEAEKTVGTFTLIIDLDQMSIWTFTHEQSRNSLMEIFRIFERYYPEKLHEALLINTPFLFEYGWSFFKPILTGNTLDKVFVLGSTDKKYMPGLLDRMPVSSMVPKLQKLAEKFVKK